MPTNPPANPTPIWPPLLLVAVVLSPRKLGRLLIVEAGAWREYRRKGFTLRQCWRIGAALRAAKRHLGVEGAAALAAHAIQPKVVRRPAAERVELLELAVSLLGPPRHLTRHQAFQVAFRSAQRRNSKGKDAEA